MRFSSSGDGLPSRAVSISRALVVERFGEARVMFPLLALGVVGVGVVADLADLGLQSFRLQFDLLA